MEESALYKMLERYARGDTLPMHMPGHKRNISRFGHLAALNSAMDITEIDSFDDLNCPETLFKESESIASKLWGSCDTVFSVNGSTAAILAAVRAVTGCEHGRTVIMARNCHKAVYHAVELCKAKADYISPQLTSAGFSASISPESVRKALEKAPQAAAVILTSPTYEGVISDIAAIAEACHSYGVPLVVDEAHGAHLSLYGVFERGAVQCGADVVIQSLHKTLPALTQTAVLHVCGDLVSPRELRRQMNIFQSSSPSYLLSASIDGCVRFLASADGENCLKIWKKAADSARERIKAMGNLTLFEKEDGIYALDGSKFVLAGDGYEIMRALRGENVELEMASATYAVAMTGAGDTEESLLGFTRALAFVSFTRTTELSGERLYIPAPYMTVYEAVTAHSEEILFSAAEGRVSAAYVYAYPPGVPIVVPGEVVDADVIAEIARLIKKGASVRGIKDGTITVIKQQRGVI